MSKLEGMDMIMSLGIVKIAVDIDLEWVWKNLLKFVIFYTKKLCLITHQKSETDLIRFLGLKDKNGKIIHFGDILTDSCNNLLTPVCEVENGEHVLFFKPVQHLNKKTNMGCKSTYSNTLEVVGNIYTGLLGDNHSKFTLLLPQKDFFDKMAVYLIFNK